MNKFILNIYKRLKNSHFISLLFIIPLSFISVATTIKSNGNIFFDPNNDGTIDQTLNKDGFGLGISSPSQKLHVSGNAAFIQGNLGLSTSTPQSSLSIQGSLGLSVQQVNSTTTLSNNSVILVDTSSDNVIIELPQAADVDGRIYHIKKKDDHAKAFIFGGLVDGAADITLTTQSSPLPFLEIISHDSQWFILSGNGYELGLSGNLVAWWTFDSSSGNEIVDRSGNGHSGNLQGGFTFSSNSTSGRMGNALSFDGTDDYIDLGNSDGLFMTNQVTIAVWYKVFAPARSIFEKASDFGSTHYTFTDNGFGGNPRPRWIINSGFVVYAVHANSTSEIDKVNWHHVVGRYSGSTPISDLWVNGVQQTDQDTPGATLSGSVTTRRRTFIGASSYTGGLNNHFLGYMDDLRVYDKALTSDEITELFESGNVF